MSDPGERELAEAEKGRGIPQVGRAKRGNKWLLLFGLAAAVVMMVSLGVHGMLGSLRNRNAAKDEPKAAPPALPTMTRDAFATGHKDAPLPETPAKAALPPAGPDQLTAEQRAALQLAERRRHAPLLASNHTAGEGAADRLTLGTGGAAGDSSLGGAMKATRSNAVSASTLAHPHLTVTEGTFLDCALVTAINSQQPGMTSCVLTRDIYSTDGHVVLLERGSRVVGQYQSAQLRQGLDRIFVLWTRVETPNGVVVNIDSPSTDGLGRSGLDGVINTHFWARFGAAILVSMIDDVGKYETNKAQDGGNTLNLGSAASGPSDAVSTILQNSVNIPPTLDKAQGGHVSIFVSRDLDFSSVYQLSGTPTAFTGGQ